MTDIANPHYAAVRLRFRQYRKHLNLLQGELGQKINLDQTAISAIEKGKQDITMRTLFALIAIDCNPQWLLLGIPPMQLSRLTPVATIEVYESAQETTFIIKNPK